MPNVHGQVSRKKWERKYGSLTQEQVDAALAAEEVRQDILSPKEFALQARTENWEATNPGYLAYAEEMMSGHDMAPRPPMLPPPNLKRDIVEGLKGAMDRFQKALEAKNDRRLTGEVLEVEAVVLPPRDEVIILEGKKEEAMDFRDTWLAARNERKFVRMDYTDLKGNRTLGRWELPLSITESYVQSYSVGRYPEELAKLVANYIKQTGEIPTDAERAKFAEKAHYEAVRTFFIDRVENLVVTDKVAKPRQRRDGKVLIAPIKDICIPQKPQWVSTENAEYVIRTGTWEALS